MRVAFVNQPYDRVLPPRQNSIGLIVYNTAVEVARHRPVIVYGSRRSNEHGQEGLPFQMRYIENPWDERLHWAIGSYPRWARRFRLAGFANTYRQYPAAVGRDVMSVGADILHVMNYWDWASILRRRNPDKKLVLEMQCEWLSQMDRSRVAEQLKVVDAVVGVSDHITSLFRQRFPDYPGIVATAFNGVDVDVFGPGPDRKHEHRPDPKILFVGRVSPEKGIHTLLEAFALVRQKLPEARLDLIGARVDLPAGLIVDVSDDPLVRALKRFYDGSLADDYQSFLDACVQRLHLADHVRFLGAVPHANLIQAYREAGLVVNPSLSESFGISVVEAMASGVPVVATRVGGMRETVLEGKTGLLVDPENPTELAAAMLDVLTSTQRHQDMSRAGRIRSVEQLSWAARARRLEAVYDRLLAAPAPLGDAAIRGRV